MSSGPPFPLKCARGAPLVKWNLGLILFTPKHGELAKSIALMTKIVVFDIGETSFQRRYFNLGNTSRRKSARRNMGFHTHATSKLRYLKLTHNSTRRPPHTAYLIDKNGINKELLDFPNYLIISTLCAKPYAPLITLEKPRIVFINQGKSPSHLTQFKYRSSTKRKKR